MDEYPVCVRQICIIMKTALKSVLLNCLFLVFPLVAEAQDIVCEKLIFSFVTESPYYESSSLDEEITDNPEENMFFHVDALLDVNDLRQDTVTLTTTVKLFPAIFGPCDVKVTQMDDSSKTLLPSRVEMKYDSIAKDTKQILVRLLIWDSILTSNARNIFTRKIFP